MGLRSEIVRGSAWSFASRYMGQALQFAASVVVARYVAPEAFGLVGMIASITAFASLFSELGMGAALVQRKELSTEQTDSAFALTVGVGAVVAVAVWAAAPFIAEAYNRASLTPIARANAGGFILGAIGVVPRALLVRTMSLRRLAGVDLSAAVAGNIASVALAIGGARVWAVVLGPLVSTAVSSALLLAASGWLPRRPPGLKAATPLIAISLNLLAFNAVNYWARTLDNVLIGGWLGERELGLYMRAYALMLLPISQITGVLSSAMLPAMSRLQDDGASARAAFLEVGSLVAFVACPVMLGLGAVARPFMAVVYGPEWGGSAPILQLLAPVGALQSIVNPVGWIYISKGRTDLMLRWALFACSLMMASFGVGVYVGSSVAVAACYLVVNIALAVPAFLFAGRIIGIRLAHFRTAFSRTIMASIAMAGIVWAADGALSKVLAPAPRLSVLVPLGVAAYVLLARVLHVQACYRAAALVAGGLARLDRSGKGVGSHAAALLMRWFVNEPTAFSPDTHT